jgi:hypothetical protein
MPEKPCMISGSDGVPSRIGGANPTATDPAKKGTGYESFEQFVFHFQLKGTGLFSVSRGDEGCCFQCPIKKESMPLSRTAMA